MAESHRILPAEQRSVSSIALPARKEARFNSSYAEKILGLVASITEVDEVRGDPDLRLYDLHLLDSLKTVELIVAFDQAFGLAISPADLERGQWATPSLIVADLERRLATR